MRLGPCKRGPTELAQAAHNARSRKVATQKRPTPEHAGTLILDFQLPDCENYISVVCELPSLLYPVRAARTD